MLWLPCAYAQEKNHVQADAYPKFLLNLHFGLLIGINPILFPWAIPLYIVYAYVNWLCWYGVYI